MIINKVKLWQLLLVLCFCFVSGSIKASTNNYFHCKVTSVVHCDADVDCTTIDHKSGLEPLILEFDIKKQSVAIIKLNSPPELAVIHSALLYKERIQLQGTFKSETIQSTIDLWSASINITKSIFNVAVTRNDLSMLMYGVCNNE